MKWIKGDRGSYKRNRWYEDLNLFPFTKFTKYTTIRMIGEPIVTQTHKIKFFSQYKEEMVEAPQVCSGLDPDENAYYKDMDCLGCKLAFTVPDDKKLQEFKKKRFTTQKAFYGKILIRPLQKHGKPYIRNARIPTSVYNAISDLSDLAFTAIEDKHGAKIAKLFEKDFNPAHPKLGFDIQVKYNKDFKTPASAYSVQFVGITPLTTRELKDIAKQKPLVAKLITPDSNESMKNLLIKANLYRLLDGSTSKGKNKSRDDEDYKNESRDDEGDYTYDDIMEMDKDELLELIDDFELSIKKPKDIPIKRLRNRVAEEMDLEEEEEKEKDSEKDDDEKELPNLDNMDKDDLVEYILEKDLDIPKPKAKKASKLRKLIEIELASINDEDSSKDDDNEEDDDDNDFFDSL